MRALCAICLLLTSVLAFGQQGDACRHVLRGVVIDDHDGSALDYTTILVMETGQGTAADSLGRFELQDLCTGTYTFRYSHIGCETREVVMRIDGDTSVTLTLEHHVELLQEVELAARRIEGAAAAPRLTIESQELEISRGQSLGELVTRIPGVSALQTGPAIFKPVIHGLHSHRVLILNDGVRLESQQWGLDHAPEIDPASAHRVSVVRGTAAVQYGADAVAGVILLESPLLSTRKTTTGSATLSGASNGRRMGGSLQLNRGLGNNWGARLELGGKRAGDAHAADYSLTNTGFQETNLGATVGYKRGLTEYRAAYRLFRSEIGILRSAHIGNLTDLEEALQRDRPLIVEDFSYDIGNPRQRVTHHVLKVSGARYFESVGVVSAQYNVQLNNRLEYDIRRGQRDDTPALDLDLHTHTAIVRLAHEGILGLRGTVSAEWTYRGNTNTPGTGVRPLIPNYVNYVPAFAIAERWSRGSVEVEGGARYERNILEVKKFDPNNVLVAPEFQYNSFAAALGIRWQMATSFILSSHAGLTRRAPGVHELFSEGLHHGAAAIEEGDTSLVPERALKWIVEGRWTKPRFELSATAYVQGIQDFIYLYPGDEPELTVRGAFPVFRYVQDDVRLLGADIVLQLRLSEAFSLLSKYALIRAQQVQTQEDLINMPADRMEHEVALEIEKFQCAIGVQHVWRQSRVPEDADFAPSPGAYTLASARLSTELKLHKNTLKVHLIAHNLLNASHREYLNRLRYYADDLGRNIELKLQMEF